MNTMEIQRHSFNLAKNRLKEFYENTEVELELEKVETEGGFLGLGDHRVTGDELNERLATIQNHFISVNTTNNKVIKEFREVYNALDVLDKDYITSIIANMKAIEKTSNDVRVQQGTLKQHHEKLAAQQSKIDAHQVEIEKNVTNISKIVTALKAFKEKLEGYKYLADIDTIGQDLDAVKESLEKINRDIKQNSEHIQINQNKVDTLLTINAEHSEILDELVKKSAHTEEYAVHSRRLIMEFEDFRTKLSVLNHLTDVDEIWNSVEKHTIQISEREKTDEELASNIYKYKVEVDQNIENTVQMFNVAFESLSKRVKYAYWLAGGSVGLAIIELILFLVRGM